MSAYLKIENPGVAPEESFTVLGASTKRGSNNDAVIGKFGTGNKQGVAVLLRNSINPVIFAGNLRMEFGTRTQTVNDGLGKHDFNRVVVKYGGKDVNGHSRTNTEDLGFVLEHGSEDWLGPSLALREFVSNALDRAIQQGEVEHLEKYVLANGLTHMTPEVKDRLFDVVMEYRKTATDYKNVSIDIVTDAQVRAKSGYTRIFVPLTTEIMDFYSNIGKWFLHFSEPEMLNATVMPKNNRNLEKNRQTAVIYRRGVRVREITNTDTPSLYDYNLEGLKLDESRQVDNYYVQYEAAKAMSNADVHQIARLFQSFMDGENYWESSFSGYGLEDGSHIDAQKEKWKKAFERVAGENAVIATEEGSDVASRKGYKVVKAPQGFVKAAERHGILTPSKVLSEDDSLGREVFNASENSVMAVDFMWDMIEKYHVQNGREKPDTKEFRKIMSGGSQTLGYYRQNNVYINQDIVGQAAHNDRTTLNQQLLVTALEEITHHVTGSTDNSRDFQDFLLNLVVYMAKDLDK